MSNTTPPGWFPDNQNPSQQRWWDGNQWTAQTRATAGPVAASANKNWFLQHKILTGILAFVVLVVIASAAGGSGSDDTKEASDDTSQTPEPKETESEEPTPEPKSEEPTPEPTPTPTPPKPKPKAIKVSAAQILQEFEENEAAADLKYGDHKLLEVTGFVSKVDTEMFKDDRYVIQISGPDYEYAFFTVNCDGQSAKDVAQVKVGQKITVGGDFQDGGDLGVELGGCHII